MSERFTLHHGDCIEVMRSMPDASVDSIVTDPPYELTGKTGKGGFMGKEWDATGIAFNPEMWSEALRVLKPGGHLLAFSGSRTYHRMAVAIEDAGFEIRDQIMWIYGSGFPKSLDVSKAIDKRGGANITWFGSWFRQWREENGVTQKEVAALFPSKTGNLTGCVANWELGFNLPTADQFNLIRDTFNLPFASIEEAEREVVGSKNANLLAVAPGQDNDRSATTLDITAPATPAAQQWAGWGTALKPAHEPIVVARKPLIGTVAANVLTHGVGALNIDGCRVGTREDDPQFRPASPSGVGNGGVAYGTRDGQDATYTQGRWPANVIHDGSEDVVELFPGNVKGAVSNGRRKNGAMFDVGEQEQTPTYGDSGSAARFFYCAKANKKDRNEGLDGFEAKPKQQVWGETFAAGRNPGIGERTEAFSTISKNHHPTVKPTELMRYLIRLVTPYGATILDPFMGSGSTGKAAMFEGVNFIGIEQDAEYLAIAKARIEFALNKPLEDQLFERTAPTTDALIADQLPLPIEGEQPA